MIQSIQFSRKGIAPLAIVAIVVLVLMVAGIIVASINNYMSAETEPGTDVPKGDGTSGDGSDILQPPAGEVNDLGVVVTPWEGPTSDVDLMSSSLLSEALAEAEWECPDDYMTKYHGKVFIWGDDRKNLDTRAPGDDLEDLYGDYPIMQYIKDSKLGTAEQLSAANLTIFGSKKDGERCWILVEAVNPVFKADGGIGYYPDFYLRSEYFNDTALLKPFGNHTPGKNCTDGIDSDSDSYIDCRDFDCKGSACDPAKSPNCPDSTKVCSGTKATKVEPASGKTPEEVCDSTLSGDCCKANSLITDTAKPKDSYYKSGDKCYYCSANGQWVDQPSDPKYCE